MKRELKERYSFQELLDIVAELRSEDGCPWDRVQTYESLKKCLSDEAQEVLDAVDRQDIPNLQEELGDVLLQVIFYADIAREKGQFTIDDVMSGLGRKLIRRHPHVFGDLKVESPEEALNLWRKVKAEEKAGKFGEL
ncbi:MAG: MazG family protein [Lachnospiraceae bacterium]|nr:MazG family protein [Lachnospiraceae bacterium]